MNPEPVTACLTVLLQSSLLVAGAWLLFLLFRKTSAARRSAVCRLTMAAVFGLSVITISRSLTMPSGITPGQSVTALPQHSGVPIESILLQPDSSRPTHQALSGQRSPTPVSMTPRHWTLTAREARWLLAVWITGAAFILANWARSLATRCMLWRHSAAVSATGAPWLESARGIRGWSLVTQVRLIPQEITPCVCGVRKSVLALPASALNLPAEKLHLILAHECAHLLRRDPFWQLVSHVFLALLWFHPLAWSLARRSRAADEQAADDIVVKTAGDAPDYADLLVACARQFGRPPPRPSNHRFRHGQPHHPGPPRGSAA
jgi:beta-lactamase regulating signal transducer with metallopeptidase domain